MTFISYAQNFEDVILWRALKGVKHGFYIDVGAAWPDDHSVTKAFYDNGWSGINIDPNPAFHALLEQKRSRDLNLRVAVGDCAGEIVMHFINETGLSSADTSVVEMHKELGWDAEPQVVELQTLAFIWKTHVPADQAVHFVKIDVEGLEAQVLKGHDWTSCRPWIVLVEATRPSTQCESHEEWESILLQAAYDYVYADGLNRFYLAREHADLAEAFRYPPNVFDQFVRISEIVTQSVTTEAQSVATEARAATTEAQAVAAEAQAVVTEAQAVTTEARAVTTEAQAVAAEAQAVVTEAQAVVTEVQAVATEARAATTEARAVTTEAQAVATEARAVTTEAQAVATEARAATTEAQAQVDGIDAHVKQLLAHILETEHQLRQAEVAVYAAQKQCEAIYVSTSWRLTKPVRLVGTMIKGAAALKMRVVKYAVRHLASYGHTRPWFRKSALLILKRMPRLKYKLIQTLSDSVTSYPDVNTTSHPSLSDSVTSYPDVNTTSHPFTPRTQQVLAAFKFAKNHYEKGKV